MQTTFSLFTRPAPTLPKRFKYFHLSPPIYNPQSLFLSHSSLPWNTNPSFIKKSHCNQSSVWWSYFRNFLLFYTHTHHFGVRLSSILEHGVKFPLNFYTVCGFFSLLGKKENCLELGLCVWWSRTRQYGLSCWYHFSYDGTMLPVRKVFDRSWLETISPNNKNHYNCKSQLDP